jgi:hypothetical protein
MMYNLHRGRGVEDEEQPPPPLPPPTSTERMQTMVEGQCLLAESMRQLVNRDARHGRQGLEPNQYSDFKDFLDTKPALFKIKYASHQLHGPAGIWWSHYRSTLPPNVQINWD